MADSKVTALTETSSPSSVDLMLLITDPNGTPVSKKITIKNLFGNIPANTSISGIFTVSANATFSGSNTAFTSNTVMTGDKNAIANLHVTSNRFTVATSKTPSTNNATTEFGSPLSDRPHDGSIFWDTNYLYVATSNTVIKRVALSTFS